MKTFRAAAALIAGLTLVLCPAARAEPVTLHVDFAGVVGSPGAPALAGWPGGQAISGQWTLLFNDDPALGSPGHLPGDRWGLAPGGLRYMLQSVGAVTGIVPGGQGTTPTAVTLSTEANGPFQMSPDLTVSFLGLGLDIDLSSGVSTLAEALQLGPQSLRVNLFADKFVPGASGRNYLPIPLTLTQVDLSLARTVPEPTTGLLVLLALAMAGRRLALPAAR